MDDICGIEEAPSKPLNQAIFNVDARRLPQPGPSLFDNHIIGACHCDKCGPLIHVKLRSVIFSEAKNVNIKLAHYKLN
jgi:hypothetical protein